MLTLRRFSKFLLNKVMLRRLPGPYSHDSGHCWTSDLPGLSGPANRQGEALQSSLLIYENGVPLRFPCSSRDETRSMGSCRFSYWKERVYFSSSDNSDPNSNGRVYEYSLSPWLYRRRLGRGGVAHNYRKREAGPEQLQADVSYALRVGNEYVRRIRQLFTSVAGRSVLEVGPGINFGAALVFACHGMRPLVADRFLAPWENPYHSKFYSALAGAIASTDPLADVSPVQALVSAGKYDDRVITQVSAPLEKLPLPDNSVDVVVSNAVVEHLSDLNESFGQLYRITKPGGYGLHQVDFRDHRNFDRPLEYLLLSEDDFQLIASQGFFECGNRFRPDETETACRAAGFEVETFTGTVFSTPEYLEDFLPRLRAATRSRYRDRPAEDLHCLSGCYRLRKPTQ
jgi:SAM-dependent methyltransferase